MVLRLFSVKPSAAAVCHCPTGAGKDLTCEPALPLLGCSLGEPAGWNVFLRNWRENREQIKMAPTCPLVWILSGSIWVLLTSQRAHKHAAAFFVRQAGAQLWHKRPEPLSTVRRVADLPALELLQAAQPAAELASRCPDP